MVSYFRKMVDIFYKMMKNHFISSQKVPVRNGDIIYMHTLTIIRKPTPSPINYNYAKEYALFTAYITMLL